jgi:predicted ATPase
MSPCGSSRSSTNSSASTFSRCNLDCQKEPSGAAQEAEGYFLKAIDIARQKQAKAYELRAATSLARLWQHQGKRAEAHRVLSEIYYRFTEGLTTKDLQEAKAVLDELSTRTLPSL